MLVMGLVTTLKLCAKRLALDIKLVQVGVDILQHLLDAIILYGGVVSLNTVALKSTREPCVKIMFR